MDPTDPSKTQSTVGTVLSIYIYRPYTGPRQPGLKTYGMLLKKSSICTAVCSAWLRAETVTRQAQATVRNIFSQKGWQT